MRDLPDSTFANPEDFTDPQPMPLGEAWATVYNVLAQVDDDGRLSGEGREALRVVDEFLEARDEWDWTISE